MYVTYDMTCLTHLPVSISWCSSSVSVRYNIQKQFGVYLSQILISTHTGYVTKTIPSKNRPCGAVMLVCMYAMFHTISDSNPVMLWTHACIMFTCSMLFRCSMLASKSEKFAAARQCMLAWCMTCLTSCTSPLIVSHSTLVYLGTTSKKNITFIFMNFTDQYR
jgi:hypothetical protein